jgi:hypothetical protein
MKNSTIQNIDDFVHFSPNLYLFQAVAATF